jgi:hypothetical protein
MANTPVGSASSPLGYSPGSGPIPPGVGAAIGGAVGSVVPGLGTVAGAAAGAVVQELIGLFSSELSKRQRQKRWEEWERRQEEKKRQVDEAERRRLEEQERNARAFYEWFNALTEEEQNEFLRWQKSRPGAQRQGGPEPIDAKVFPSFPGSYSPVPPSFGPSGSVHSPSPYYPAFESKPAFALTLTEREGQLLVIGLVAVLILTMSNK